MAIALFHQAKKLAGRSRWEFPSPQDITHIAPTALSRALNRCTFEKPVSYFTPHDLRRTATTYMTAMGISTLAVSKILNHVDRSVTAIYDRHSYDPEKIHILTAWSNKLAEITSDSEQESNIVKLAS